MDLGELVKRFEALESEQKRLGQVLEVAQQERDKYRGLYQQMLERCRKLERGLLAQGSERRTKDEQQLSLGLLELMLGEREKAEIEALVDAEDVHVSSHTRTSHGRKPVPEHLPRVDIEIIPDEVQREGLDASSASGKR